MMKTKETLKDYGIDDIQIEKALYQMLIDQMYYFSEQREAEKIWRCGK